MQTADGHAGVAITVQLLERHDQRVCGVVIQGAVAAGIVAIVLAVGKTDRGQESNAQKPGVLCTRCIIREKFRQVTQKE